MLPFQHQQHCLNCFWLNCQFANGCTMVGCECGFQMHECKLEDHIQHICARALVQCPNAVNGCSILLRRHKVNAHVEHCPASIVHCPFIRNRQFLSERSKKILKQIAKGQKGKLLATLADEEELLAPDIATAHIDQAVLERFFSLTRAQRSLFRVAISQRDLDEFVGQSDRAAENRAATTNAELEDSSDEEQKAKERHYRRVREPFSGCRLCKMDPGSQHLHQLGRATGNGEPDAEEAPREKQSAVTAGEEEDPFEFLPLFHRQRGLLIKSRIAFLGVVADEHYFRTNFPIFGCREFVRRDQYSAHCSAHLALDEAVSIARCPNWQYGCPFKTEALAPCGQGVLRFNPFLGCTAHVPMPVLPPASPCPTSPSQTLEQLPVHFFKLFSPFLDDSSLCALSSTCRRLRVVSYSIVRERTGVGLKWTKAKREEGNGKKNTYVVEGLRHFFGTTQGTLPALVVRPLGPMGDHIRHCNFGEPANYGNEPIDLRKFHGGFQMRDDRKAEVLFGNGEDGHIVSPH